jgi:hypothetical protein
VDPFLVIGVPEEGGLKKDFGDLETFAIKGEEATGGELVSFLEGGGRDLHFGFVIEGHIAKTLFDVTDEVHREGRGEGAGREGRGEGGLGLRSLCNALCEGRGKVGPTKGDTVDRHGEGVPLVDRDCRTGPVPDIQDKPGGPAGGEEGEDSRDGNKHGGNTKIFKHDLR